MVSPPLQEMMRKCIDGKPPELEARTSNLLSQKGDVVDQGCQSGGGAEQEVSQNHPLGKRRHPCPSRRTPLLIQKEIP